MPIHVCWPLCCLLPFIYLFMYPFLSHELVFIIGCIYVVKLCGKVAVADSSCMFSSFWGIFFVYCFEIHPVSFALYDQIDNLIFETQCVCMCSAHSVFMGSFWPLLLSSNARKAFRILVVCLFCHTVMQPLDGLFLFSLFLLRYKEIRCNEHTDIRVHALNSIHNLNHVHFDIQLHCFHI